MSEIKVGDELAFCGGYEQRWEIHRVEKITPTGRIRCGRYELNPDLTVRGWSSFTPRSCEPVTDKIRERYKRQELAYMLNDIDWTEVSMQKLERIAAILAEENQ